MNLLISGCSFTHWPAHPGSPKNICWPTPLNQLRPDLNITNLAEPGAGNVYIANSVVRYVLENPDRVDFVLIMWSGVTRLDLLTDISNNDWHALFDSYGFYRRVESCPNTLGYIFSGGQYGPWVMNQDAGRIFKPIYKVSSNLSLGHLNLVEIIKTQHFLKSKNIPYRFMSYVNYWNTEENCSPNGDFGVLKYPELRPLINEIDWNDWIFQNEQRDGIYEMARAVEDYNGDRFHPGAKTNLEWAKIIANHLPATD
jgi:hypothetical protein